MEKEPFTVMLRTPAGKKGNKTCRCLIQTCRLVVRPLHVIGVIVKTVQVVPIELHAKV
jgi:hypothetical protein